MRNLIGLILYVILEAVSSTMWTLHNNLNIGRDEYGEDRYYDGATITIGPVFCLEADCLVIRERFYRIGIGKVFRLTVSRFTTSGGVVFYKFN